MSHRVYVFIIVGLVIVYLIAGLVEITPYVTNGDSISYISLAQKYARGDLAEAVNGLWSPLLSWLLVPPLLMSQNPVVAAKVILLLAGLVFLFGVLLLARRFNLSPFLQIILAVIYLPVVILVYVPTLITPDLLTLCPLIFYLYLIFDPDYFAKRSSAIFCGVLGGLGYFSKNYIFFFFLAHLAVFTAYCFFNAPHGKDRRRILVRTLQALIVFAALSGTWVAVLSCKYHRLTISTAGSYNFAQIGTHSKGEFTKHGGLYPPPNSSAVSAWEDPSLHPQPSWSPFQSKVNFTHYLRVVADNSLKDVRFAGKFSWWTWPILLVALCLAFRPTRHRVLLMALATLAIYNAGYLLVRIEERYVYLNEVLILLMGCYLLALLFGALGPRKIFLKIALAVVFTAGFWVKLPALQDRQMDTYKSIHDKSQDVLKVLEIYAETPDLGRINIASNCCFQQTLFVAYYDNLKYFGHLRPKDPPASIEREIKTYGIDFFFVWTEGHRAFRFLKSCPEVTHGQIPGLEIYDLRAFTQCPGCGT